MDEPVSVESPTLDIAGIRDAVVERFGARREVLGAQLGVVVRSKLSAPRDLKARYGGLKAFVGSYLGDLVHWRGRRGLDDLYDVGEIEGAPQASAWRLVEVHPSPELWASVTNPSVSVQFALGEDHHSVYQAPRGAAIPDRYAAVAKLSRVDYQELAVGFLQSLTGLEPSARKEGIDAAESSLDFNRWIRGRRLLPQWENYRVKQVISIFVERLTAGGGDVSLQEAWRKLIEDSHALFRQGREGSTRRPGHQGPDSVGKMEPLDPRVVVSKALLFMSDEDVRALRIPVGAMLRAIESLR